MTTSNHLLPRRRSPRHADQTSLGIAIKPCSSGSAIPLRKGATFHAPTSASSPVDPTLHVSTLPSRSLTSPKDLEELIIESQKKVAEIIRDFDRSISLSESSSPVSLHDILPVPSVFLAHAASNHNFIGLAANKTGSKSSSKKESTTSTITRTRPQHDHASDSGLGSSIDSECEDIQGEGNTKPTTSVNTSTSVYTRCRTYSAVNKSFSSPKEKHSLDEYATAQIQEYLIDPLLDEDSLKDYHPLVEDLPDRIASKKITCLRDIEKTLIFLAEFKAKSSASYLAFCNLAIQCVHTTANHLNDIDQRRPADRPYTNTYFVDLVEQVRQYARIMAITRQKKFQGDALDEMDHKSDERLRLSLVEGKPAELVRERADGTTIPIEAGYKMGTALDDDSIIDADMERSMARKRKCDIGKIEYRACRECDQIFTRACDLTKHEKTHSRPWKCPETDCKYHSDGWPTEKERDRHVNDKHMRNAPLFKCLFQPCAYSSKRESNCKQHMEKAHGWEYVRAKSKKGQKLIPSTTPHISSEPLPTPDSDVAFPSFSTPDTTTISNSPNLLSEGSYSPGSEIDTSDRSYAHGDVDAARGLYQTTFEQSLMDSHATVQQDVMLDMNMSWNGTLFPSPDCPDLLNTPGTGYSHSPANQLVPTLEEFEFNFDIDENSPGWQRMQSYFPQWFEGNSATSLQSNPAVGDFGMTHSTYGNGYQGKSSSDDHSAITLAGTQEQLYPSHAVASYVPPQTYSSLPDDFTLFTEGNGFSGPQTSTSAHLFPASDLGAVGGQFGTAEESIYDEPMDTEDKMMEQFMNFDDEDETDMV